MYKYKSRHRYVHPNPQVGRALRRAPNKRRCVVLDCVGLTWRFGPVAGPLATDAAGAGRYSWEEACPTAAAAKLLLRRCACGALHHASVGYA